MLAFAQWKFLTGLSFEGLPPARFINRLLIHDLIVDQHLKSQAAGIGGQSVVDCVLAGRFDPDNVFDEVARIEVSKIRSAARVSAFFSFDSFSGCVKFRLNSCWD